MGCITSKPSRASRERTATTAEPLPVSPTGHRVSQHTVLPVHATSPPISPVVEVLGSKHGHVTNPLQPAPMQDAPDAASQRLSAQGEAPRSVLTEPVTIVTASSDVTTAPLAAELSATLYPDSLPVSVTEKATQSAPAEPVGVTAESSDDTTPLPATLHSDAPHAASLRVSDQEKAPQPVPAEPAGAIIASSDDNSAAVADVTLTPEETILPAAQEKAELPPMSTAEKSPVTHFISPADEAAICVLAAPSHAPLPLHSTAPIPADMSSPVVRSIENETAALPSPVQVTATAASEATKVMMPSSNGEQVVDVGSKAARSAVPSLFGDRSSQICAEGMAKSPTEEATIAAVSSKAPSALRAIAQVPAEMPKLAVPAAENESVPLPSPVQVTVSSAPEPAEAKTTPGSDKIILTDAEDTEARNAVSSLSGDDSSLVRAECEAAELPTEEAIEDQPVPEPVPIDHLDRSHTQGDAIASKGAGGVVYPSTSTCATREVPQSPPAASVSYAPHAASPRVSDREGLPHSDSHRQEGIAVSPEEVSQSIPTETMGIVTTPLDDKNEAVADVNRTSEESIPSDAQESTEQQPMSSPEISRSAQRPPAGREVAGCVLAAPSFATSPLPTTSHVPAGMPNRAVPAIRNDTIAVSSPVQAMAVSVSEPAEATTASWDEKYMLHAEDTEPQGAVSSFSVDSSLHFHDSSVAELPMEEAIRNPELLHPASSSNTTALREVELQSDLTNSNVTSLKGEVGAATLPVPRKYVKAKRTIGKANTSNVSVRSGPDSPSKSPEDHTVPREQEDPVVSMLSDVFSKRTEVDTEQAFGTSTTLFQPPAQSKTALGSNFSESSTEKEPEMVFSVGSTSPSGSSFSRKGGKQKSHGTQHGFAAARSPVNVAPKSAIETSSQAFGRLTPPTSGKVTSPFGEHVAEAENAEPSKAKRDVGSDENVNIDKREEWRSQTTTWNFGVASTEAQILAKPVVSEHKEHSNIEETVREEKKANENAADCDFESSSRTSVSASGVLKSEGTKNPSITGLTADLESVSNSSHDTELSDPLSMTSTSNIASKSGDEQKLPFPLPGQTSDTAHVQGGTEKDTDLVAAKISSEYEETSVAVAHAVGTGVEGATASIKTKEDSDFDYASISTKPEEDSDFDSASISTKPEEDSDFDNASISTKPEEDSDEDDVSIFTTPEAKSNAESISSKTTAVTTPTWDYKSPYRGECDEFVLNNPPTGLPCGINASGNKWTNLGNGAYHYSNYGTDGGFYIKNADGSTYHFSGAKSGRYTENRTASSSFSYQAQKRLSPYRQSWTPNVEEKTWDYQSPYRGQCDDFVWKNPPPDLGYGSGWNQYGNKYTTLGNGGYHYQNKGSDGGFYIRNSDGSSYHFSPSRGGSYRSSY